MASIDVVTYVLELEDKVSRELKEVRGNADRLEKSLNKLRAEQERGRIADEKRAKTLATLKKGMAAAAVAFTALGVAAGAFAKSSLEASASMEKFEAQLTVLLGSADAARERLELLFEIGSTTPFELDQLVAAEQRLESFGASGDQLRQGVMDLVGALGGSLPDAALAVGKSFAAGKAGSDSLRESYALLFRDIDRRAQMLGDPKDIQIWQQAIVEALNDTQGVVAGGTATLASTFGGQLSNLSDQWFKFKKKVGDAGLFEYAKLGVGELLAAFEKADELGDNFARMMSEQLIGAFEATIRVSTILAQTLMAVVGAFKFFISAIEQSYLHVLQLKLALGELRLAMDFTGSLAKGTELGQPFREELDRTVGKIQDVKKSLRSTDRELKNMATSFFALNEVPTMLDNIRREMSGLAEVGPVSIIKEFTPGEGTVLDPDKASEVGAGTVLRDPEPAKKADPPKSPSSTPKEPEATPAELFLEKVAEEASKASESALELVSSLQQTTESEKFANQIDDLVSSFEATSAEAERLGVDLEGPEMQKAFRAVEENIRAISLLRNQALEDEAQAAYEAARASEAKKIADEDAARAAKPFSKENMGKAVGAIGSGAMDVMETGGLGMLSAAGPGGAAAASLIGMGTQGAEAHEQAVDDEAANIAKERVDDMKAQRKQLKAEGMGEADLARMGLGEEDLQEATEVTKADEEAALAEVGSQEDFIADQVTSTVKGVIEGIKAIAASLPNILADLIPMFMTELPVALISMIGPLIEALIPVLMTELPKAIFNLLFEVFPKLLKMLFLDLPVALVKGIGDWWSAAWKEIAKWFKNLFSIGNKKDKDKKKGKKGKFTGGFIPQTGDYLLHQGERVVPSSGADTGTARGLQAFTGGNRSNVTINTSVVDPDAIPALGKMLDRQLGAFGRMEIPLFGSQSVVREV